MARYVKWWIQMKMDANWCLDISEFHAINKDGFVDKIDQPMAANKYEFNFGVQENVVYGDVRGGRVIESNNVNFLTVANWYSFVVTVSILMWNICLFVLLVKIGLTLSKNLVVGHY